MFQRNGWKPIFFHKINNLKFINPFKWVFICINKGVYNSEYLYTQRVTMILLIIFSIIDMKTNVNYFSLPSIQKLELKWIVSFLNKKCTFLFVNKVSVYFSTILPMFWTPWKNWSTSSTVFSMFEKLKYLWIKNPCVILLCPIQTYST